MLYTMIVKTETSDNGRAKTTTETIRNVPADELDGRRETARMSAPAGSTRTIKVVDQVSPIA